MLKELMQSQVTEKVTTLFSYLFNYINKYEYREALGKDEAKELWNSTKNNGYILKNCKLYIYARHKNPNINPSQFSIEKGDARYLSSITFRGLRGCKAYSLTSFDKLESDIVLSLTLRNYIGKFINKKLRFLIKSYGQGYDDLFSDLQAAAIYALRKQYPYYESELHAMNICKTAIHNVGQGLIEFHTRKRRQALFSSDGVFQSVSVPYDSLADIGIEPAHEDCLRLNIQSLVKIADSLPKSARAYLSVLAGIQDPGFSLFLGEDNSNLVDTYSYGKYRLLAMEYFSVSESMEHKLFQQIKTQM
jgi:hypothetical protein